MNDFKLINSARTKKEIEKIVILERLYLYNEGLPCGPKAIRKKLENEINENQIPSISTIARILKRNYLTHRRTGYYKEDYL
jgi:putative transposase